MPSPPKVPIPTLERLATYMRMLVELSSNGSATISSAEVEVCTGVDASQFRKDLSYFGMFGKPGVGYDVASLQRKIARILRIDSPQPVVLIGAGNLGAALVGYPGMAEHNFEIRAVFDNNFAKIGRKLWDTEILDINDLESVNREIGARIAILAVPSSAAQEVAEHCVRAGMDLILNFAPTHIKMAANIFVRDVSFLQELAVLSFHAGPSDDHS